MPSSNAEKLQRAIRYALSSPDLPSEIKRALSTLAAPGHLAIAEQVLAAWVSARLFGVGEALDVILLGAAGSSSLSVQGVQGFAELVEFGHNLSAAKNELDLRRAASRLIRALKALGVEDALALLSRQIRIKVERGNNSPLKRGKASTSSAPPRTAGGSPQPGLGRFLAPKSAVPFTKRTRSTGASSGDESPGGGKGLGRLAGRKIKVSERGLAKVEEHLKNFTDDAGRPFPENELMLERLRNALREQRPISDADASFYMHELAESTMMARGIPYESTSRALGAHDLAILKYGVDPRSVYHPEVIQKLPPGHFNNSWLEFWGIGK